MKFIGCGLLVPQGIFPALDNSFLISCLSGQSLLASFFLLLHIPCPNLPSLMYFIVFPISLLATVPLASEKSFKYEVIKFITVDSGYIATEVAVGSWADAWLVLKTASEHFCVYNKQT